MSFSLLDKIAGPLRDVQPSDCGLVRHFKYGLRAAVDFKVDGPQPREYTRPTAVFTNVVTTAGRLAIEVEDDMEITDGINARLIDDCGQLSTESMFEALKGSGQVKSHVSFDMALNIVDRGSENFVGVIFNLLRLYYITLMKYDDYALRPGDTFYNDGHVAISYAQQFGFTREEEPLFETNSIDVDGHDLNIPIATGDFYPYTKEMSQTEFSILKTAVAGWRCDYPIRLFSTCPPLATRILTNNSNHLILSCKPVQTMQPSDVLSTLQRLVHDNHVESQFDLAYMLLCQAVFMPVPRAAEANAWVVSEYDFKVPRAGSVRGANRMLLSGVPYNPRPAAAKAWKKWPANRNRLAIHAAALCEAIYTGAFEIMTRGEGSVDLALAEMGLTLSGGSSRTRAVLEFCSYRFGERFKYPWATNAGIEVIKPIVTAIRRGGAEITVDRVGLTDGYDLITDVIGGKEITRVIAKAMKPVLFPVLSYGINDDRYYLNSLNYGATIVIDSTGEALIQGSNHASKYMAIMRMGGFEVSVRGPDGVHTNWAANSNGHSMAIPPSEINIISQYRLNVNRMRKRDHCWMDLSWAKRGTHNVSVCIRPFGYAMFYNGRQEFINVKAYVPVTLDTTVVDEEKFAVISFTTGDGKAPYTYSDFLFSQEIVQPEPAESLLVSSDIKPSQYIDLPPEQDSQRESARLEPGDEA